MEHEGRTIPAATASPERGWWQPAQRAWAVSQQSPATRLTAASHASEGHWGWQRRLLTHERERMQVPRPYSLTSESECRYQGRLVAIDRRAATVELSSVRCMGDEGRRCGQGAIAASDQIFERIVFGCVCVVCALVCMCVLTHTCVCVCCLRSGVYRFTDTYMHVFPHTNAHTRTSMYV